jgi:hypothetical protein
MKGRLPRIMNTTAVQCTAGCGQCASDRSDVEKPPVDIEAIEWLMASKGDMPATQKARKPRPVSPR